MANAFTDLGKATLDLGADGIIHLAWQPGITLVGTDADTAMARVNDISQGNPHPLLVTMSDVTLSHDARATFAKSTAASRIALLGTTPVDWMMAHFHGRHTKPCPTRFFTNKSEAIRWLLQ